MVFPRGTVLIVTNNWIMRGRPMEKPDHALPRHIIWALLSTPDRRKNKSYRPFPYELGENAGLQPNCGFRDKQDMNSHKAMDSAAIL